MRGVDCTVMEGAYLWTAQGRDNGGRLSWTSVNGHLAVSNSESGVRRRAKRWRVAHLNGVGRGKVAVAAGNGGDMAIPVCSAGVTDAVEAGCVCVVGDRGWSRYHAKAVTAGPVALNSPPGTWFSVGAASRAV